MKKKLLITLLSVTMLLAMMPTVSFAGKSDNWSDYAATQYSTAKDDTAKTLAITSEAEFAKLANDVNGGDNFKGYTVTITNSLDLSAHEWSPIRGFQGTLDGNNKTISGLKITTGTGNLGLFASTASATIKDLTISGANISGESMTSRNIGVVVGDFGVSKIQNVKVSNATVNTNAQYVGGLVGISSGTIVNSEASGCSITGKDQVGGLVGYQWCNGVCDCKSTNNTVKATEERASGLIGKIQISNGNDSFFEFDRNIVSGGSATAPDYAGGLAAQIMGDFAGYTIKDNSVSNFTLSAKKMSPIGTIRDGQNDAFMNALASNVTGNTWTEIPNNVVTYYTYGPSSALVPVYGTVVASIGTTLYGSLEDAIANAQDGDTIVMKANCTIDNPIDINKKVTINLNNKTVSFAKNGFAVENGALTLDGTGTVELNKTRDYTGITLKGSTSSTASNYSCLTVKKNVKIVGTGYAFGIVNNSNCAYGVVASIYGRLESQYGVTVNGGINKTTGNVPELHFYPGSYNNGLYAAGYAKWTLEGDQIAKIDPEYPDDAVSGLSIKCGDFKIKSGKYKGVGTYAVPVGAQYSGSEETGAAVSITTNSAYTQKTNVEISGGTFESADGAALYEGIAKNGATPAASESCAVISISGGQFKSKAGQDSVVIQQANDKKVITGGFFSEKPAEAYIANGYVAMNNDGSVASKTTYPWTVGYGITYEYGNGSKDKTVYIKASSKVTKPSNPSWTGHTFTGWFKADGTQFLFDKETPTSSMTLTAHWLNNASTQGDIVTENKPNATINSKATIPTAAIPLTTEEITAIGDSANNEVKASLEVEKVATPQTTTAADDATAIHEYINEEDLSFGSYLDIILVKAIYINGVKQDGSETEIHETLKPIKITVEVPENLREAGREYSIIRCHEGEVEVLYTGKANGKWEISFETDKFSTYSIAYEDKQAKGVKTGDSNNLMLYVGLFAMMALVALGMIIVRGKAQKK